MSERLRELHAAVAAVCPVHGVSIGRKSDKATWRPDFAEEATLAQRAAAAEVIAAFDIDAASVPVSVKMWQAKAALAAAGKLATATAAIEASGSEPLKLAWEYATDISRASASVAAIGGVLGMTSAEVDALFIAAAQIEV